MRYSAIVLDTENNVDELWNPADVSYYTKNDTIFDKAGFRGSIESGLAAFNSPDAVKYIGRKRTYGLIVRVPDYHPLFNLYLVSHEDNWCISRTPKLTSEHTRTIRQLTGVVDVYIEELVRGIEKL